MPAIHLSEIVEYKEPPPILRRRWLKRKWNHIVCIFKGHLFSYCWSTDGTWELCMRCDYMRQIAPYSPPPPSVLYWSKQSDPEKWHDDFNA